MAKAQSNHLSEDDVRHIAALAKLHLTEDEVKKFQKQLSSVLDYIGILNEVDTSKLEQTSQVTQLENIYRKDEVTSSLTQKQALSGTSKKHNGYFLTDAVFEEE